MYILELLEIEDKEIKKMMLKKKIKQTLLPFYKIVSNAIFNNNIAKYMYLKIATFLSTHGIAPFLSPSAHSTKKKWERQGDRDSDVTPSTYMQVDQSIPELFKDVMLYLGKDDPILEIGCNAGRSLNYLFEHGYRNLSGVEIGHEAVELMKTTFPDVYENSRIIVGDITQVIRELKTAEFDLVFCHSVLVNIHPRHNIIFKEIARISKKFILILENEGSYAAYPRDFRKLFEKQGYEMIIYKKFRRACHSLPVPFEFRDYFENNSIRLFVKNEAF